LSATVQRLGTGLWLLGLALYGCRSQGAPAGMNALALVPPRLDLGVLVEDEAARATVELTNAGATLRLRPAASSARCRWQGLPEAIAERTTVPLSVECQSDLLGPLHEELTILDATDDHVVATLRIAGNVEPIIGFDTAFVDLRPELGQTASVEVHLIGKRAAQAAPKVTSTGADLVTAVLLGAPAGSARGFRVSCKGDRVGMHAGSLVVETGVADRPTLTLSWGCRVPATLDVQPANPYFNLRVSGDRATTIRVTSSQPGFAVSSARVIEGPFRASLAKPDPDGSIPITIRVNNDAVPDEARAATGTLLILSNDRREPRKEVPLFGFGKVNKAGARKSN
jgi:hypothetical protein